MTSSKIRQCVGVHWHAFFFFPMYLRVLLYGFFSAGIYTTAAFVGRIQSWNTMLPLVIWNVILFFKEAYAWIPSLSQIKSITLFWNCLLFNLGGILITSRIFLLPLSFPIFLPLSFPLFLTQSLSVSLFLFVWALPLVVVITVASFVIVYDTYRTYYHYLLG